MAHLTNCDARPKAGERYAYFEHDADIGIIGRGATVEEAPGAYKDVDLVAEATEQAGLARRVAFLRPKICIKG